MEQAYIIGEETLEEIAKRFNVPITTVNRHAMNKSWKKKRDDFFSKAMEAAEKHAQRVLQRRRAQSLIKQLEVADTLRTKGLETLETKTARQWKVSDSLNAVKQSVDIERKVLGQDQPDQVIIQNTLMVPLFASEEKAEAEAMFIEEAVHDEQARSRTGAGADDEGAGQEP
jgi:hypothetical protein